MPVAFKIADIGQRHSHTGSVDRNSEIRLPAGQCGNHVPDNLGQILRRGFPQEPEGLECKRLVHQVLQPGQEHDQRPVSHQGQLVGNRKAGHLRHVDIQKQRGGRVQGNLPQSRHAGIGAYNFRRRAFRCAGFPQLSGKCLREHGIIVTNHNTHGLIPRV